VSLQDCLHSFRFLNVRFTVLFCLPISFAGVLIFVKGSLLRAQDTNLMLSSLVLENSMITTDSRRLSSTRDLSLLPVIITTLSTSRPRKRLRQP
jgi:hypothetical protein